MSAAAPFCQACALTGRCTAHSEPGQGRRCEKSRLASQRALLALCWPFIFVAALAVALTSIVATFFRFYRYFRSSGYSIRRAAARAWAKACEPDTLPFNPVNKEIR